MTDNAFLLNDKKTSVCHTGVFLWLERYSVVAKAFIFIRIKIRIYQRKLVGMPFLSKYSCLAFSRSSGERLLFL